MTERAFQDPGELLTKALISGDFTLYRSILTLPMNFTPKDGQSDFLSDEAALREDFELYGEGMMAMRLVTRVLGRANLLVAPFPARITVQEAADGWRTAEIESSEGHLNWTLGRSSVSSSGAFEMRGGVNGEA
jgi:hypothetical protein